MAGRVSTGGGRARGREGSDLSKSPCVMKVLSCSEGSVFSSLVSRGLWMGGVGSRLGIFVLI